MVTYILDASAILRYLDDDAGAARVAEIIKSHLAGTSEAVIAALHWGEIDGVTCKAHGRQSMDLVLSRLSAFGIRVVPADRDQAVSAALIKLKRLIPYVDAFGIALAAAARDSVFVTAEFDFKPASGDAKIEFLPAKTLFKTSESFSACSFPYRSGPSREKPGARGGRRRVRGGRWRP